MPGYWANKMVGMVLRAIRGTLRAPHLIANGRPLRLPCSTRGDSEASMRNLDTRINKLFQQCNEPVIPIESIHRWLAPFDEEDRSTALLLLESIEFHSYPRLIRETRLLHEKLKEKLSASGFDAKKLNDVDFSREFACKSGDIISYIYRKSNLIPTIDFKTFDRLVVQADKNPVEQQNRALVILDDYIGTGSQFIFQFIARSEDDIRVIGNYKKVYLACIAIHEKAIEKGLLLREGRIEEVIKLEEAQIPDVDFKPEKEAFRVALNKVDWNKIELVYIEKDKAFLSEENESLTRDQKCALEKFLSKYCLEGCEGSTSFLLGRHAFFYGAPNSLPAILLPFFKRVEDFTVYSMEHVTGITSDIINYDLDNKTSAKISCKRW